MSPSRLHLGHGLQLLWAKRQFRPRDETLAIISGNNTVMVLQSAEFTFDAVAVAVKRRRKVIFPSSGCLQRDVWHRAFFLNLGGSRRFPCAVSKSTIAASTPIGTRQRCNRRLACQVSRIAMGRHEVPGLAAPHDCVLRFNAKGGDGLLNGPPAFSTTATA
jgi:hypothetical protein